ncbi:MAG: hypothetical protein AAF557_03635 [Pseudomonadota bacterium]
MSTERLARLYALATHSDDLADWQALWQALAGSGLILPLKGQLGELVQPRLTKVDGLDAVEVFADMDSYAEQLAEPADYAEMDGAQLAAMAVSLDMPLAVKLTDGQVLMVPPAAVDWIASTFRADVDRADSAGVHVSAPDLPSVATVEAMGQTVGGLGDDCPEAWLVHMTEPDAEDPELVLVLGLADNLREMETEIAEAVTRSIQSVSGQPVAVACADRGSPLMDAARRHGIGIGG